MGVEERGRSVDGGVWRVFIGVTAPAGAWGAGTLIVSMTRGRHRPSGGQARAAKLHNCNLYLFIVTEKF